MNDKAKAAKPQMNQRSKAKTGAQPQPSVACGPKRAARRQYRQAGGFTLIEVMIVIAILGVLAAISIPAYQDYIENTNMAKVTSHFEGATRFAETELRKVQTDISVGRFANLAAVDGTGNYTQAGLVAMLNGNGGTAPGGGDPYVEGAGNATTGAIGVTVTGTLAAGDWQATFERPKIYGFARKTTRAANFGNL